MWHSIGAGGEQEVWGGRVETLLGTGLVASPGNLARRQRCLCHPDHTKHRLSHQIFGKAAKGKPKSEGFLPQLQYDFLGGGGGMEQSHFLAHIQSTCLTMQSRPSHEMLRGQTVRT